MNAAGRLVGFDVEMAHALVRELGGRLEFVRVERKRVAAHVNGGTCDLAMSGLAVTTGRAREVAFSTPYMDNTLAFLVPDHRRHEFTTWGRLREKRDLRITAESVYLEVAPRLERASRGD